MPVYGPDRLEDVVSKTTHLFGALFNYFNNGVSFELLLHEIGRGQNIFRLCLSENLLCNLEIVLRSEPVNVKGDIVWPWHFILGALIFQKFSDLKILILVSSLLHEHNVAWLNPFRNKVLVDSLVQSFYLFNLLLGKRICQMFGQFKLVYGKTGICG